MERRQHRRVPVQLQGFLLGNSHEIEAVTLDLSVGGARFDCDLEVYPGKVIRVRLVIPGAEEPVSIEEGRCSGWERRHSGSHFRMSDKPSSMNSSSSSTSLKKPKTGVMHSEPILDSFASEEYRIPVGGA